MQSGKHQSLTQIIWLNFRWNCALKTVILSVVIIVRFSMICNISCRQSIKTCPADICVVVSKDLGSVEYLAQDGSAHQWAQFPTPRAMRLLNGGFHLYISRECTHVNEWIALGRYLFCKNLHFQCHILSLFLFFLLHLGSASLFMRKCKRKNIGSNWRRRSCFIFRNIF